MNCCQNLQNINGSENWDREQIIRKNLSFVEAILP